MKFLNRIILFLLFLITTSVAKSQLSQKEFDDFSKEFFEKYLDLLQKRGGNTDVYLKGDYQLQNDPGKLPLILKEYYRDHKIAVLLYFHTNDKLISYVVDKKSITKAKEINISQNEIVDLNKKITSGLALNKAIVVRSPVERGAGVSTIKGEKFDFEKERNKAAKILLPDSIDLTKYQHIIIVPCLNLGAFPFYLLPLPNHNFFVDALSYSIAPSMIEIEVACKKKAASFPDAKYLSEINYNFEYPLLVANPSYPKNATYYFPDLPGAQKEIDSSINFFNNYAYYSGKEATKENVLKEFKKHDLVYFATHGLANSANPLDSSFIVLADGDAPYLSTREIMRYKDSALKMNMVILSACQTGLGKIHEAGIIGLSRSFQLAGANHVIMSLWNVNDDATAFLMQHYLKNIQQGDYYFPAEPLRKAILKTKEKYPDPSLWASFALFGIPY